MSGCVLIVASNVVAFNVKVNWSEDFAVAEVVDCMSSDGGDTSEGGSTREIEDGGECLSQL